MQRTKGSGPPRGRDHGYGQAPSGPSGPSAAAQPQQQQQQEGGEDPYAQCKLDPPVRGVRGLTGIDGGYNNYVALWYQQWMGAAGQQGDGAPAQ